ncbi:MAG: hypothetical protein CMJ77_06470 [Planctomycetaceae bacterium]|nr:hypothetical protein [Planctomycetaceae bacterium]
MLFIVSRRSFAASDSQNSKSQSFLHYTQFSGLAIQIHSMGAFQVVNRSTHTNQLMKEVEFPMKRTIWRTVPALALAALLTVAGSTQADLEEGLVGYWPLDGDFVDHAGTNDGTFMGSDPEAVFETGVLGDGIVLDGIDQYIEIANESNFDFVDQDFSISAWFRVDSFTKSWQALIAKGEGNRWRVHRRGGESIMTWNGGNGDVPADANFPIDDEEFHHFVGVSTADEIQMYMDGELVSIGDFPTVENNDQPVMIGENPDARGRTWHGLIDDVAIWGRALDEDEIAAIYNGGDGMIIKEKKPTVDPIFVGGQDTIGSESYDGSQSNRVYGEETPGVSGWSGRIVTFEDSGGVTINDHDIALGVLEDNEGLKGEGAYEVVDFAGGGGNFGVNNPYPNDVSDTSMSDFVVEVTAEVTIPAGTWTIGFGSDDGGRIEIPGVEFDLSQNNDNFSDDEIRYNGNRGHGWTVGSFTLGEGLETTITASFHERGGGDSFEIAVIEDEFIENASEANGWELLGDGTLGWSVNTTTSPLISADLTATVTAQRPMQFDVNGDTGEADQLVLENPDSEIFTTIMDLGDNLEFQIKSSGNVSSGQAFQIIGADQVTGTPTISSINAGQNWVFDAGRICLDFCPGIGNPGDYNGDGMLDAADLDLQAAAMNNPNPDLGVYDENNDGLVDFADRQIWVSDLKVTWMGDADLNGQFNSGDLVTVFTAGKYESGDAANWGEGDWNGDLTFGSGDLVTAFTDGGYEAGPKAAVAAVPEPSSIILVLTSLLALFGVARRRNG